MDLGTTSLNQLASKLPKGHKLTKSQIDEVLPGVKTAYAGEMYEQAALRSLYVAFSTQNYKKVRDLNSCQAIQSIPKFSTDILGSLGLSDWEDCNGAKAKAKSKSKGKAKAES